jgi:myosin heavy subunit
MIPMGAIMSGVQGIAGIAGGLIGAGKRKREQRAAQADFNRRKDQFEMQDTSNLYTNLENVYEDLTVNQQQAEFTQRAQQQSMANTMSGMQGAAGGSGIAALAQAMANQASQNAERAGISIGQQERSNQAAQMQQAAQNQLLERQGEGQSRAAELNKVSTLMGMAGQRLGAANEARAAGKQAILGGVGNILGGAGQALPGMMR